MKCARRIGFTLIELMIVVAIIGILAAVAAPKFGELLIKSKEANIKGNLGTVRSALSIYYGDQGLYPQNLFLALATSSRYAPSVKGVESLGEFNIPENRNNPGHPFGNITASSQVSQPGSVSFSDDTALIYVLNSVTGTGEIYLNCFHRDNAGIPWTTY